MHSRTTSLVMFAATVLLTISAVTAFPLTTDSPQVQNALSYLNNSQLDNGSFGDAAASYYSDLTPFAIVAIKAANQDPNTWIKNSTSPVDFLLNHSIPALNNSSVPTYYGVNIMALIAAGKDPQNAAGRNLTGELIQRENADGSFNGSSWITDTEWSILALVAAGYKDTDYVKNATEYLKTQQLADGGFGAWCPNAGDSCPDETALGIMAFLAAGLDQSSSNVQNAVARLKTFQVSSGGFDPGFGTNVDTDAWATQAIVALGNNFENWSKSHFVITTSAGSYTTTPQTSYSVAVSVANNGNNHSFDNMLAYQDSATGGFVYFKPVQDTSYAIMAMLGKQFPINGTSYTQSESINAGKNQTFFGKLAQTLGWEFTLAGNGTQIETVNSADMTFTFAVPSNSTGAQNNITFSINALLDNFALTKDITITVQAPPSNPGDGTPSSPSGGGGGGGGGSTTTQKPKEEKKEAPKKEPAPAPSQPLVSESIKEVPQPAVVSAPQADNSGGPTGFAIFSKKATIAAAVAGAGILGFLLLLWKKAALSSTVSI